MKNAVRFYYLLPSQRARVNQSNNLSTMRGQRRLSISAGRGRGRTRAEDVLLALGRPGETPTAIIAEIKTALSFYRRRLHPGLSRASIKVLTNANYAH